MNVTATLLAGLIGSINSTNRGVMNCLSSEIEAVFVERQFLLKDTSLVFWW